MTIEVGDKIIITKKPVGMHEAYNKYENGSICTVVKITGSENGYNYYVSDAEYFINDEMQLYEKNIINKKLIRRTGKL